MASQDHAWNAGLRRGNPLSDAISLRKSPQWGASPPCRTLVLRPFRARLHCSLTAMSRLSWAIATAPLRTVRGTRKNRDAVDVRTTDQQRLHGTSVPPRRPRTQPCPTAEKLGTEAGGTSGASRSSFFPIRPHGPVRSGRPPHFQTASPHRRRSTRYILRPSTSVAASVVVCVTL